MPPSPKALVDFFGRSLSAFSTSGEAFRVLCTVPHSHDGDEPQPRPPQQPPRDLIVLDSSFNPPTTAHASMVHAAAAASTAHGVGRVLLLLAVENADKPPKPASFPLRLCMMEGLGRELVRGGGVDAVDVGVTSRPFFHDKARAIEASGFYRGAGGATGEVTFLAGYDTLVRIFNPKYYGGGGGGGGDGMRSALDPFFRSARLRVTMRTGDQWGGREEQLAYLEGLAAAAGGGLEAVGGRAEWARRVELVDGFEGAVSSSKVREVVSSGVGGLGGLVGDEVKEWIEREGLYKDG